MMETLTKFYQEWTESTTTTRPNRCRGGPTSRNTTTRSRACCIPAAAVRSCASLLPIVGEKTNGVRVPVSILRKRSSDPKSQPPVCPVIKKSVSIAGEDSSLGSSRAPLKLIDGRRWSPGIYRALRLHGRILEVAWEGAFM